MFPILHVLSATNIDLIVVNPELEESFCSGELSECIMGWFTLLLKPRMLRNERSMLSNWLMAPSPLFWCFSGEWDFNFFVKLLLSLLLHPNSSPFVHADSEFWSETSVVGRTQPLHKTTKNLRKKEINPNNPTRNPFPTASPLTPGSLTF